MINSPAVLEAYRTTHTTFTQLELMAIIETIDARLAVRRHVLHAPGFEDALMNALAKLEDAYQELTGKAI